MSKPGFVTIYTDGASRGNPGPAAIGYVIKPGDGAAVEVGECLPRHTTNNVAEYTALIRALEHARTLGAKSVSVFTDSELMVKQIKGQYQVKNEKLRPLYEQVLDLKAEFDAVKVEHVRREQNRRADELCNEALDGRGMTRKPAAHAKPPAPAKKATVHEQAVECLRGVAQTWARGDANNPKPEMVWDQLWSILEEEGVVRKESRG
jgi:ribonuclease HI